MSDYLQATGVAEACARMADAMESSGARVSVVLSAGVESYALRRDGTRGLELIVNPAWVTRGSEEDRRAEMAVLAHQARTLMHA